MSAWTKGGPLQTGELYWMKKNGCKPRIVEIREIIGMQIFWGMDGPLKFHEYADSAWCPAIPPGETP